MGQDISKEAARFGSLFIQTDKSTYFGGDTVTGKVYLNLLMPFQGNQLFLKLRGKEFCAFTQTQQQSYTENENGVQVTKQRDVDVPYDETRDIIKLKVPMYTWPVLLPGQYTIPFAFMLPNDLPSSFHQEGHKHVGDISYVLSAMLAPFTKGQTKLKYRQTFVVRQPIKSAMQGVGNEIRTNLTACCSGKGSNVLKAKFEKNYYAPGEIAQVIMQLDNTQSQLRNVSMIFALKQRLTLKAKGKDFSKVASKVSRTLDGVPAGGASDSNFISVNLPTFQGGDYTVIKTLNLLEYLKSLKDNDDVLNSATKGKLITSEYFLEVSCPMDGCCAPTPSISCPIEIYYPEIQLYQPPVPSGWAPQEISCVNVSFSGPSVQMNTGGVSVNVNMDPMAMAAGTMMAAGNIMGQAMMGGQGQMTVTSQQPASTIHTSNNVSNTSFQVNNQMPGSNDGFHMTMNTQVSGNQTFEHNNGGFHASFKMN